MEKNCRLNLKIIPNARLNECNGIQNGVISFKIKAPPAEGKANRELVNYLSSLLDIPKSSITIIRGHTSRNKAVDISGISAEDISSRLGIQP